MLQLVHVFEKEEGLSFNSSGAYNRDLFSICKGRFATLGGGRILDTVSRVVRSHTLGMAYCPAYLPYESL
jgi:hypothetical protein